MEVPRTRGYVAVFVHSEERYVTTETVPAAGRAYLLVTVCHDVLYRALRTVADDDLNGLLDGTGLANDAHCSTSIASQVLFNSCRRVLRVLMYSLLRRFLTPSPIIVSTSLSSHSSRREVQTPERCSNAAIRNLSSVPSS